MNCVKEIRERLGLTQEQLAEELGCTQGNIGHYERGSQDIPPSRAVVLIDVAARHHCRLSLDQVYGRAPLPKARAK